MRTVLAPLVLGLLLAGCGARDTPRDPAQPKGDAAPSPEAPRGDSSNEPASDAGGQRAIRADSTSEGSAPELPVQRKPLGYALVYPGSSPTGVADQTTEGSGEKNRIVHRTTKESMETVAAFFTAQLGLQETLSLADRKILTGPLPDGGRIAITLTRPKGGRVTNIEVVAVTPL